MPSLISLSVIVHMGYLEGDARETLAGGKQEDSMRSL